MTHPQLMAATTSKAGRRLTWFALGAAVVSFAITTANAISGVHTRWTAWVLPLLIAANCAVFLGALKAWPGLARLFPFVSIGVAAAVFLSEFVIMMHR